MVKPVDKIRQVHLWCYPCVTFFGRYMYECVIRLRVTDLVKIFDPSTHYILVNALHCMDLPSAARRLKVNFSGVIAFDFSIDVVANTVFGSHETKKTYQDLVSCSNGNK